MSCKHVFSCLSCTLKTLTPVQSLKNGCSACYKIPILRPPVRDWPVVGVGCLWPNLFLILSCRVNNVQHGFRSGWIQKALCSSPCCLWPRDVISPKTSGKTYLETRLRCQLVWLSLYSSLGISTLSTRFWPSLDKIRKRISSLMKLHHRQNSVSMVTVLPLLLAACWVHTAFLKPFYCHYY